MDEKRLKELEEKALAEIEQLFLDHYVEIVPELTKNLAKREAAKIITLEAGANRDSSTGLLNEKSFIIGYKSAQSSLARKNPDALMSFLLISGNTKSQEMGDRLIIHIALSILSGARRDSDLIGKFGDEEFGVALPDTNTEGAILVAQKIQAVYQGFQTEITNQSLNIGIVTGTAADDFFKINQQAADAIHFAKEKGKDRIAVIEDGQPRLIDPLL